VIVTLTANPSFDRTIELSGRLDRGGVIRADAVLEQAGGKGVNISRVAAAAGVPTTALFPAGADSAYTIELEQHGIPCRPVPPTGPIRVNLTLTEPDGTTTKVNSTGTTVDAELLVRLREALEKAAVEATWVVLAGSLPPGAPTGWYAELAEALADLPAAVAVDTSDDALVAVAARLETTRPGLLKPNAHELALLTGGDPSALEGANAVLVTHEHFDHFVPDKLRQAMDADPGLEVWTNGSVADQLEGLGSRVHVVGDGDAVTVAGFDVHVHGELHAEVHPDIPRIANIGFLVEGLIFHPGDVLPVPDDPVATVLLPVYAPWSKVSEVIDYVRAV